MKQVRNVSVSMYVLFGDCICVSYFYYLVCPYPVYTKQFCFSVMKTICRCRDTERKLFLHALPEISRDNIYCDKDSVDSK